MHFNFKGLVILLAAVMRCNAAPLAETSGAQTSAGGLEAYPNQYVVRLTPNMEQDLFDSTIQLVRNALGQDNLLRFTYFFSDFRGFSMEATPSIVNTVSEIPGVVDVEPNWMFHQQIEQQDCTYGLDRISHRINAAVANRPYVFNYYRPAGAGTVIYVIDSGIYTENVDFTGRALKGENYAPPNVFGNPNDFKDYTGHGTHVASIAGGYNYGVAKYATLVDVKVLNDNGTGGAEHLVAGISYATNTAQQRGEVPVSVIQFSIGGPIHPHNNIIGYAMQSAINAGMFCGVAAGNSAINAEYVTPAAVGDVCTVGATDATDTMASFSNFGQVIDIWAPGVDIPAAGIANPHSVVNKSGTSMATPYVSGVAAYLKSFGSRYTSYGPVKLCQELANYGTKNDITFQPFANPSGPNVILFDLGNEV